MIEYLTGMISLKRAHQYITELIDGREEWIYTRTGLNSSSALRNNEISLRVTPGRLMITCLTDEGISNWRISGWEWTGEKLLLDVTGRRQRDQTVIELVPRASARAITELISDTRRARCYVLANLTRRSLDGASIRRMNLSPGTRRGQPGRDARILLERGTVGIAVTGAVAEDEGSNIDLFLSSALVWYLRTVERSQRPTVRSLWLVASAAKIEALTQRIALLREGLRSSICLFEIDDDWAELKRVSQVDRDSLFKDEPSRLPRPYSTSVTESAKQIISLAPDAIDVLRARGGETLRFHGLAFARVRRLFNRERIWFGTDGTSRQLLNDSSNSEWQKLVGDLLTHRDAMTSDRRHAYYRAAPEAWLESMLRRNITRLDPGLRIAPIHAQFRTTHSSSVAARPVDLLALRHDGRLAVIELKVGEDRTHVLQGVDYWRRVEAHRRCGNITRARLFDDAVIADEPPLVYLAAPMLSFHRAFSALATAIAPDIKLYRFDLNEDWRREVRVMRRAHVN